MLGVVVGAVVGPGVAHAADGFHNCGSNVGEGWTYGPTTGAGIFDVKARKVSCRKARYIAVHHNRWSMWHSLTTTRSSTGAGRGHVTTAALATRAGGFAASPPTADVCGG